MARDRLHVLLAVRQEAVDHALRDLADAIARENAAAAVLNAIDAAVPIERAAADQSTPTLFAIDDYVAWSVRVRLLKQQGVAALREAEAQTARARTEVASARADAEAVGQLIVSRERQRVAEAERRDGHALDDIARAQRRARLQAVRGA